MCQSGSCVVLPSPCADLGSCPDDDDPCTTALCDPSTGCTQRPVDDGTACDDNNAWTKNDVCQSGVCAGQAPKCPKDNNACTTASCDPANGCGQSPVADGTECDDNLKNRCTDQDVCGGGACAGIAIGVQRMIIRGQVQCRLLE